MLASILSGVQDDKRRYAERAIDPRTTVVLALAKPQLAARIARLRPVLEAEGLRVLTG